MKTVLLVLGTRPEAVKLAPVWRELKRRSRAFKTLVCVTGQHRELIYPMLHFFGMEPDIDLKLMRKNQTLPDLTARLIPALDSVYRKLQPDWVLVQGDTTTVMAAALAAYYRRIQVGHVEAGLRTDDKYAPFPEEINRRMAGVLADIHFTPTSIASARLRKEGIAPSRICLTGNTVVDALQWTLKKNMRASPALPPDWPRITKGRKLILVTGHRRENFGAGMENMARAFRDISEQLPDTDIVYPVHLNPNVRKPMHKILGGCDRIHLIEPVDYPVMVKLLKSAWLVLTDSGGIQEEAPTFGLPCLILRDMTERPEGIQAGVAQLVGTGQESIVRAVIHLYRHPDRYRKMALGKNPYGDGKAALRIVDWLEQS